MVSNRAKFYAAVVVGLFAACGGSEPAANNAQNTTATATASAVETATAAATTATAAPTTTAAPTAEAVKPPPPKPAKEKVVGKWQFSFEGDVRTKAEEELKKKFAKEKDTKKFDAEIKKLEEAAALEWVEFTADTYASYVNDAKTKKEKAVLKTKFEVVKDENTSLTMKPVGKPEVGKIDPKAEVVVTFKDDNTITIPDPKKGALVFKRK